MLFCKHNIKKIIDDIDRFLCAKRNIDSEKDFFPLGSESETARSNRLIKL